MRKIRELISDKVAMLSVMLTAPFLAVAPVYAIDLNQTTTDLRNQIKIPYLFIVAIVAGFLAIKKKVASAIITLVIGLIFGIFIFSNNAAESLMTWLAGILQLS